MPRRTRRRTATPGVVGYVRVSTTEQADSGLSLDSQRAAIEADCARRGLPLLDVLTDTTSGKSLDRPALSEALSRLDHGDGTVLMVAKLDRLTRSVHDATGLLLRAERAGWGLVALDVAVDTTTPQGAAMAQVMAVFAELERRLIGQRTRDALAVKRAQGARLGRPRTLPDSVVRRIMGARQKGEGWSAIARQLDAAGVPTAHGAPQWSPATVRAVWMAANRPRSTATEATMT